MRRCILACTGMAALVVFAVVQDRVTAAGATRYGELALSAIARHEPVVPVDAVMRPAIRRSLWLGGTAAAATLVIGVAAGAVVSRRRDG